MNRGRYVFLLELIVVGFFSFGAEVPVGVAKAHAGLFKGFSLERVNEQVPTMQNWLEMTLYPSTGITMPADGDLGEGGWQVSYSNEWIEAFEHSFFGPAKCYSIRRFKSEPEPFSYFVCVNDLRKSAGSPNITVYRETTKEPVPIFAFVKASNDAQEKLSHLYEVARGLKNSKRAMEDAELHADDVGLAQAVEKLSELLLDTKALKKHRTVDLAKIVGATQALLAEAHAYNEAHLSLMKAYGSSNPMAIGDFTHKIIPAEYADFLETMVHAQKFKRKWTLEQQMTLLTALSKIGTSRDVPKRIRDSALHSIMEHWLPKSIFSAEICAKILSS